MDGAFHVTRPDGLADGMMTSLGVLRVGGTPQKPVVRVDGVKTREAVEALRGTPIVAEVGLEEGEVWAEELVGRRVVDGEHEVGVVERVLAYPSCEVLVVTSSGDPNLRGSKDETLLIPFVDDAVRSVEEVIDVDLPYPRTEELRLSPAFTALRNRVWSAVYHQEPTA